MGNVSQVIPTIHPSIAICAEGVPGHSIEFRDAAASPRADEVTLLAATVVAQTAYELFADPALVEAAWARVPRRGLTEDRTADRAGGGLPAGATIADGAPRWTLDANRRRPQGRNDPTGHAPSTPAPSPGGPRCPSATIPTVRPTSPP